MTDTLLSVRDARAHILEGFRPVSTEEAGLDACLGRVLAREITAPQDMPLFSNSSMDGFAVRAEDVPGAEPARPVTLAVVGDIPAGTAPAFHVGPGQAARIMTGAPLPGGADAVIPVEDTDQEGSQFARLPQHVAIYQPAKPGQNVRPRGQDMRQGEALMQPGRILQAQDIGLLAALGIDAVTVYRRPRVGLFSSGDEIVSPGQTLAPGQVYDSNTAMLAALLESAGAQVIRLGAARDDPGDIYTVLHRAVDEQVDVIVTSAGVSVGAFDYVRRVIETHGQLTFWRVNMRPGKPLAFGSFLNIPLIGLPGNPVSAYVGARVFVMPVVDRLAGRSEQSARRARAVLKEAVESDGRESYLRARVYEDEGKRTVVLTGHQGSGNLFSLVQANALLIVPSGVKSLPSGAEVDVLFF